MGEASLWGLALGEQCPEASEEIWGWIVYPLLMLYSFYILAQICDGHLTTALEFIVDRIQMSEDVAGATFLAMASSAPELFTSIISTFVLESASGVGNILGSAVFNLLVIIGVVPIFSGQSSLRIWWYPTARDSFFYVIAILEVFLVMLDSKVYWWEGLIMTLSYLLYTLYFTQNERIIRRLGLTPPGQQKAENAGGEGQGGKSANSSDNEVAVADVGNDRDTSGRTGTGDTGGTESEVSTEEILEVGAAKPKDCRGDNRGQSKNSNASLGSNEAANRPPESSSSRNSFTLKGMSKPQAQDKGSCKVFPEPASDSHPSPPGPPEDVSGQLAPVLPSAPGAKERGDEEAEDKGENEEGKGWCRWEPVMMLINMTMPTRSEYMFSLFGLCCLWIGIFTYFAVDASTRLGCMMNLDHEVMGLVVLAAGTSVPDAMGSIAVAKDGLGDMAVANAVGSNTFDILLGLGLPWFVWALAKGEPIVFKTQHLFFAIGVLFVCLVGYLAILIGNGWMLTRKMGLFLLFSYSVVIFLILMRYYGHI